MVRTTRSLGAGSERALKSCLRRAIAAELTLEGVSFLSPLMQDHAKDLSQRVRVSDRHESGSWSAKIRTCASRPGPRRPRSIGRDGRGAWVNISQLERASAGGRSGSRWRAMFAIGLQAMAGVRNNSSSSVTSSPTGEASRRSERSHRTGDQFGPLARDSTRDGPALRLALLLFVRQAKLRGHLDDGDHAGFQSQLNAARSSQTLSRTDGCGDRRAGGATSRSTSPATSPRRAEAP